MGMIYQRGKVYWIKYYRNGKPYRESTRSKKEADATINRELSALKRLLTLGVRQYPPLVDKTQIPWILKLKENNIRKGFFEHHEYLVFKAALPPYLRNFFTFGYKFGCRSSEIRNLIWDQVDFEREVVHLEKTKNGEDRTIPPLIMRISGHKTREIFDRYNIVDERDLHEASEKVFCYLEQREVTDGLFRY
jgi:integrase